MPPRLRSRTSFRLVRTAALVALCALVAASAGCFRARHARHHAGHGFVSEQSTVQVVSALVGGKNVFIPSTIVAVAGEPLTLSIYNTTDVAHGFAIPTLGVSEVLPPQQEHQIVLDGLEGHRVLQINCQLHTAHRTATLVVLPGRKPR